MAPKPHLNFRVEPETLRELDERAARSGRDRTALARRYVEEGLRTDEHPLIRFSDGALGRRASLVGCGLDVWEAVETIRVNNGSLEEAAAYLEISCALVQAAASYYAAYPDEVDAIVSRAREEADRAEALDAFMAAHPRVAALRGRKRWLP